MSVSESQKIAVKKYREKTYDTIGFDVPKGKREEFKFKAAKLGFSLAKFLFIAAESYGTNHAGEVMTPQPKLEPLSAADKQLIDEFARLPVDVQKCFLKTFKAINQNAPQ